MTTEPWASVEDVAKHLGVAKDSAFFVRSGDMLAAGVVFLGIHYLSFGVAGFARANILIVLAALGVGLLLLREYQRLPDSAPVKAVA